MTRRPIHRWKSFWLGIFVVGFLAWASWDSTRFQTWALCGKVGFSNLYGAATLNYHSNNKPGPRWFESGRLKLGPLTDRTFSFFEAPLVSRGGGMTVADLMGGAPSKTYRDMRQFTIRTSPRESWMIYLPHWLAIVGFAVPWAGFLVWKARRQRNLTA